MDGVHDKFHVSKYLGEAVDKVRRREQRELILEPCLENLGRTLPSNEPSFAASSNSIHSFLATKFLEEPNNDCNHVVATSDSQLSKRPASRRECIA
ncbi:transposase [Allorhodopirellula solitaria]|uniref:transposase n=1 Tax=Allorhodopirellula solitaria TaxID=2527987 RepID=UPI001C984A39